MSAVQQLVTDLVGDVETVLLFDPGHSDVEEARELGGVAVVVADVDNPHDVESFVELPISFESIRERVRFGMEGAMDAGYVEDGDVVACLLGSFTDELDTLVRVRANESMQSGVYELFSESRPEPGVVRDVLTVAIELGKKGQKGEPVGALFVVGDAGTVMNKSRPLSYNPFEKSHVHVGDPIVKVMLKEFSRLDGAFVVSDAGKIVSAYRYLEPAAEGVDIPKGLGARHMAAGAITRDTNAVAIVLSESDGLVRAFRAGELVLELDPEDY